MKHSNIIKTVFVLTVMLGMNGAQAMDLSGWKIDGSATLDATKTHSGMGASLKLAPGSKAVKTLRTQGGLGKASFWVYDDGTVSSPNPKGHRVGPSWGLVASDGKALVVGVLYTSWLKGETDYSVGFGEEKKYYNSSVPVKVKREVKWNKWDIVVEPVKQDQAAGDSEKADPEARNSKKADSAIKVSVLLNDKPVDIGFMYGAISSFTQIVLVGDENAGDKQQTFWVDDVTSELGPELPSILPEKDPAPEGDPVKFVDKVAGKHPRLLITAERLPQVRAFFNSENGAVYRKQLLDKVRSCIVPKDRRTDGSFGQDVGLYRMPTVALHYLLTGDKTSFEKSVNYLKWLICEPNWSLGGGPEGVIPATALKTLKGYEPSHGRNTNYTAGFTMVGAALTYDWLYNDLDPELREQVRLALWTHARVMYHGGHLGGNPGEEVWNTVIMYNHRWFRDYGLTLATLAASEGKPDEQWLLGKVRNELKYVSDWLPSDGSSHEGPNYGTACGFFGTTLQVSDECLGTHFLDRPFFHNAAAYTMALCSPDLGKAMCFGDCFTKVSSPYPYCLKMAAVAHQVDVLDGIRHFLQVVEVRNNSSAWLPILLDDPTQGGGDYTKLPTTNFFPDLGIGIVRESWKPEAVAAMFKCGPPGGHVVNKWREAYKGKDGKLPYACVAHDHPDANAFTIFGDGDFMAETDRYPLYPGKLSSGLNTILINGMGQVNKGRHESEEWMQPSDENMTDMAKVTAWKDAGDVVVVEGEAGGSYLEYTDKKTGKSRPALDRFRRTFVWVKGGYILILDDVRSPAPVQTTWLVQGAKLDAVDAAKGTYHLSKNKAECDFQLLSDAPLQANMGVTTANDHGKNLGWQQLQANADGKAVRFVSIFDSWHHHDLKLTFTPAGPDKATVMVSGNGIADKWEWESGKGKFEAATLHGLRQNGFDVLINAQNATPPAHQ